MHSYDYFLSHSGTMNAHWIEASLNKSEWLVCTLTSSSAIHMQITSKVDRYFERGIHQKIPNIECFIGTCIRTPLIITIIVITTSVVIIIALVRCYYIRWEKVTWLFYYLSLPLYPYWVRKASTRYSKILRNQKAWMDTKLFPGVTLLIRKSSNICNQTVQSA